MRLDELDKNASRRHSVAFNIVKNPLRDSFELSEPGNNWLRIHTYFSAGPRSRPFRMLLHIPIQMVRPRMLPYWALSPWSLVIPQGLRRSLSPMNKSLLLLSYERDQEWRGHFLLYILYPYERLERQRGSGIILNLMAQNCPFRRIW